MIIDTLEYNMNNSFWQILYFYFLVLTMWTNLVRNRSENESIKTTTLSFFFLFFLVKRERKVERTKEDHFQPSKWLFQIRPVVDKHVYKSITFNYLGLLILHINVQITILAQVLYTFKIIIMISVATCYSYVLDLHTSHIYFIFCVTE